MCATPLTWGLRRAERQGCLPVTSDALAWSSRKSLCPAWSGCRASDAQPAAQARVRRGRRPGPAHTPQGQRLQSRKLWSTEGRGQGDPFGRPDAPAPERMQFTVSRLARSTAAPSAPRRKQAFTAKGASSKGCVSQPPAPQLAGQSSGRCLPRPLESASVLGLCPPEEASSSVPPRGSSCFPVAITG